MPESKVYNIDCLEFMRGCKDKQFDLAVVDPPYGIKRDGGFGEPIARKQYSGKWDSETPQQEYFNELLRISKECIIWGGNFFTDKLPVNGHWIFWDKKNTMPTFGDGELAYTTFARNSVKQVTIEYNGLLGKEQNRIHATQKPVKLYKWLLHNYAKPNDTIFDSHLGSQSSRIAAYDMGFDFTGCELDKDYFEQGCKRFENFKAQLKLF